MLACEKKWHKQCFKCTLPGCGRVLAKGGYLEKDGMPYEQLYLFIKIPNSTFYFSDLLCMNNKAIVVDRHYTPCFYPSWLHIRARPCHHQRTVPDPHLPLFTLFFLSKKVLREALLCTGVGRWRHPRWGWRWRRHRPRCRRRSCREVKQALFSLFKANFWYFFILFFLSFSTNTITNKKSICKLPHCTGHPRVS